MKIKLTTAQAQKLWQVLNENDRMTRSDEMTAALGSKDLYAVWDALDDKLALRGLKPVSL